MFIRFLSLVLSLVTFSGAWASEGGLINIVNWYYVIAEKFTELHADRLAPVLGALFVLVLVTAVGYFSGLYKLVPEKMSDEEILPPKNFGFRAFLELAFGVVSSTLESVIGERWTRFAPLLGGTFFFILLSNLSGLVPGFAPPTESMNMTLGMASVIFICFNYYGLKYAGISYIKHLGGPIIWIAPIMFVIETIGLFARPVSLSLRLFGNITGDHLVFQVFSTLVKNFHVPWMPIPAGILIFGLLVACLQSFIFMTLSAVYVKLSIETAHNDH